MPASCDSDINSNEAAAAAVQGVGGDSLLELGSSQAVDRKGKMKLHCKT